MSPLKKIKDKLFGNDEGLGDTFERAINTTGLNSLAETYQKATGKDCGCKKRKEKLNKMFPYK